MFRVISSDRDDLVLQAESKEGMNDWLFGFHRALAGIIARVMETGSWPVEEPPPRLLRGGGFNSGHDVGGFVGKTCGAIGRSKHRVVAHRLLCFCAVDEFVKLPAVPPKVMHASTLPVSHRSTVSTSTSIV